MLVFEERGKPEYPEKNLSEQGEKTDTYDTGSRNRTQATLVGGEHFHHCATPAPPGMIYFQYNGVRVSFFQSCIPPVGYKLILRAKRFSLDLLFCFVSFSFLFFFFLRTLCLTIFQLNYIPVCARRYSLNASCLTLLFHSHTSVT